MTNYKHITLEHRNDGLATVTLNRPPANALNLELITELGLAAEELSRDGTRVTILQSSQKIFQAGADLSMVNEGWETIRSTIVKFQGVVNAWEDIPGATIAVINGHAAGGGCEMTMACDFRLMARGTPRIGLPEVLRGLLPGGGGTQRMGRILGRARALDMCTRGRMIDADEAERIGLVMEAVDPELLSKRAQEFAAELLALPFPAFKAIKRCVLKGLDTDLTSGLKIEEEEMTKLGSTEDAKEGVRSFLEKREPVFQHR